MSNANKSTLTPDSVNPLVHGVTYYLFTSSIVCLGTLFGIAYLNPSNAHGYISTLNAGPYANWDGQWYISIARDGYSYNPSMQSNVAFLPAFPLLGRAVAAVTGLNHDVVLVIISNALLAVMFIFFAEYLRIRSCALHAESVHYTLLAFGLFPTSFFFRMAYTEAMFLLLTTLTLYAIHMRWSLVIVAGLIGLATATRVVAIGLIPLLVVAVWQQSPGRRAIARLTYLLPISAWGIILYAVFLYAAFGDPLAFVRAQSSWDIRSAPTLAAKIEALVALEPLWSAFHPTLQYYNSSRIGLFFIDPVVFLIAASLAAYGAWAGIIDKYEIILCFSLLMIPYISISYESYCLSLGRYSASALPIYIVIGRLLARARAPIACAMAGVSGFLLGACAALFSAWYLII